MLFPDIVQSVGRTPLVELRHLDTGGARIFVKMESRNPCGSVKDRVGVALIEDAERRGVLKPGATLVEPTSGNTGIALAFVAAAKGYRADAGRCPSTSRRSGSRSCACWAPRSCSRRAR